MAEDGDGLREQRRDRVREAGERRRRQRLRAAVTGQVGDEQPPPGEQGRHLRVVPGGAAEAVQEQKRPPLAAPEDPEPDAPRVVEAHVEAP